MRSIFIGASIFDGDFNTRRTSPVRAIRGFKPPAGGFPIPWGPDYEEEERRGRMAATPVRRGGPWAR